MVDKNKRALRFTMGYSSVSLNALAWVMTGILSPNPYAWWLIAPLLVFSVIIGTLMIIAYMDME